MSRFQPLLRTPAHTHCIVLYPPTDLHLTAVGGEQWSKGSPGEAMPSEVKAKTEEPPRASSEVDRLTRNPEKLVNAGGRCWKHGRSQGGRLGRPPL